MQNKIIGGIILGISVLIGLIIYLFNRALTNMASSTCTHGSSCSMWKTIQVQTSISIIIMAFVVLIGIYMFIFGDKDLIAIIRNKITRKEKAFEKEKHLEKGKNLPKDEKEVFNMIVEKEGSILQSEIVKNTELSKVKVSRIIDKIEGRGLVFRKRRGMTNVVIIKH